MNHVSGKITSFTDLDAWKQAHQLVISIYRITKGFPRSEMFGLTNQIQRCAVSITSNIAEGFSRQSYKEKLQFYSIALGSVTELQNQLLISRDVKYISPTTFIPLADQSIRIHKIINGLIKHCKAQIGGRNT